jgi:NAD(P)H-dependent flavin oxidoreductase YrpB (nitropropane dioxygenase family)
MATRFITTFECDADLSYKEYFLQAKETDIRYVISPSGYPGRAIDNELVTRLMNAEKIKVRHCYNCLKPCNPATTPYCITEALIQAVKGNIQEGLVFTGTNGYRNKEIVHVSELIDELFPNKEIYQ